MVSVADRDVSLMQSALAQQATDMLPSTLERSKLSLELVLAGEIGSAG